MPHLEELNLSKNAFIKIHTFQLNASISLKRLDLGICELRDISTLADILYKMAQLEELILFWNEHLKFYTFQLIESIPFQVLVQVLWIDKYFSPEKFVEQNAKLARITLPN